MRTTIDIWICKLITKVCHIFGKNGSVFPGSIIYKIDKNVLKRIKYPKDVVVVTGSSGKGSTVNELASILESNGKKVLWQSNGSNINNAVVTLVLNNTKSFSHKVDADILLLEMDEKYISKTFSKGIITHLLITNVTRDQPSRNIDPEFIFNKIMESVDQRVKLIINVDDPILNRAKRVHTGKIITYGIAKNKYDEETVPSYPVDAAYCPICHAKLIYKCYHYGHIGIYSCPSCDFKREKPDYEASKIDLKNGTFCINGNELTLDKNVFFAVYYNLAAYTLANVLGLSESKIVKSINKGIPSKRMNMYILGERRVVMLESKNENALSYLQSLNFIKREPHNKCVIMGFENVSRRYSYNDLSWLWDVNFEILKDDSIEKIFLIGRYRYDLAVRLNYAAVDSEKIVLISDINDLLDTVEKESTSPIYTMVCFDMTETISRMLKEKIK